MARRFRLELLLIPMTILLACDQEEPPQAVPPPPQEEEAGTGSVAEVYVPSEDTDPPEVEYVVEEPEPVIVVPDFQIWTRVRLRHLADEQVPSTVRVSVADGEVTLSGEVESGVARARARRIAELAYGVNDVHDDLTGPEPTAAERQEGESVPEDILAVEPQFGPGLQSWESGEIVEVFEVVSRPPPEPSEEPTDQSSESDASSDDAERRTYEVQSGDTLWNIAADQMGDGGRWQELYQANRDLIGDDPDGVRAGQVLVIPE